MICHTIQMLDSPFIVVDVNIVNNTYIINNVFSHL
jgi:hypothetical protein